MDTDDLRERVISSFEELTPDGPHGVTFRDIVEYVTPAGQCVDCMESPVRKVVTKLINEGAIGLVLT